MRSICSGAVVGMILTLQTVCAAPATLRGKTLQATGPGVQSGRAVLVELFTSEGCSSCPPADDLLRQVDGTRTAQGALIVGVSEHVTYWDHDGWKDPFGSDAITARQEDYRREFALDSVYTPQMVVDGESQFVGSDARSLVKAAEKAQVESGTGLRIGALKLDSDRVEAAVSITGTVPAGGADVYAVVAEDETTEHVLRGENRGRTLKHASVARTIIEAGRVKVAGETSVRLELPSEGSPGARRHLIVWVQVPGPRRVLAVDTKSF